MPDDVARVLPRETSPDASGLTKQPYWDALSSAAQRMLLREARSPSFLETLRAPPAAPAPAAAPPAVATPTAPGLPSNIRVNDPADDIAAGNSTTQSEPSLAVSGLNVVVGYNDSNPADSFSGWAYSRTAGQTFADDGGIPGGSGDAVLAADRNGDFYYASLARNAAGQSMIGVARSTNGGQAFGALVDASTTANGAANFQDKEWLAADATGGAHDGNLYLAWTNFLNNFATAQIMFARSTDGGATWSAPLGLSTQGPGFGHQGAMPTVGPNGEVYVAWLDRGNSQVLIRRSDDGGQTFGNPVAGGGAVAALTQIPGTMNGNIRANSFPSVAVDPGSGDVYVAYAARDGADQANVYLVRSTDQGQTWGAAVRANDDGTTTDQWMPSVAATANGVVGVMFYDRRNDAANLNIDVYLAMSTDGGQTFLPNQRITTTSFPPAVNFDPRINTNYMGDYNHMVAVGTRFYMVWGDNRDTVAARGDPNVYFATVGTEDCYVRDNPADDGSVPSTPGLAWLSPDIRPDMNPSVFGTPNPVHIEAHNRGPRDAEDVTVRLYWTDPATHIPRAAWRPDRISVETSPGVFTATNEQRIAAVPAGGGAEPPQPFVWDPPKPAWATEVGHFCLLAEIESAGDPLLFTGGGWETIERENNLAVRNVHVQEVGGERPSAIRFFVAGDERERWKAEITIDARKLPEGMQATLTLPAGILGRARFDGLEVVERTEDAMTLAFRPGGTARIVGLELAARARHQAELAIKAPPGRRPAFREAPLTLTQRVGGRAVGGLLYLLRPRKR